MTNSRNMWDSVASYYDAVWEVPDYSPILKAINKETKAGSAGTILDVATGTGTVALDLAKGTAHRTEIIGLDVSRAMLEKALEKAETTAFHNVQFILGDAHNLPFRDDWFDAVTCCFCLPWFAHPEIAISETRRVVKPARKVVCVEYEKPPVEFWAELRRKAGIKDFDKPELIAILRSSGLKKVQAEAISVIHSRPNVPPQLVKRSELYTLTIMGLKEEDGKWFFPRIREEYRKLPPNKRHWLPFLYRGTK